MERVRDARLDNLCQSIGEGRDEMGKLREQEQADLQVALERMRMKGLHSYRHAGLEMARVPGAEVLRVRLVKDKVTAPANSGGTLGEEFADERAEGVEGVETES